MRPFLTLHDPRTARRHHAEGLWRNETFYGLLAAHALERPSDEAVVHRGGAVTWQELRRRVDGAAVAFRELGLVPGDRVSVFMGNRIESLVTFLASAREGLACNPSLHRTHTTAEVVGLLDRLSSRVLVTEPGWGADRPGTAPAETFAAATSVTRVFVPEDFPAPLETPLATPFWDDPDTVRYLAFTSGTTGTPKCVMHSDNTLLANARDLVADWRHGPRTRLLTLSPLSHHIAWVAVAEWLVAGGTLILDDPPAGVSRLDWIERTGATYVMGVPTHAMDVLAEQRAAGRERIGDVTVFYMAGAPIPPSVCEAFVRQGIVPQNVYGMTENSSHQYTHPTDSEETVVATCGRGGRAYEVRIFDMADRDREVPVGTVGEIGGRGACLMLGYFGNQEATEASFNAAGWFLSGDLGALDEKGNLTIHGRTKELIIRGGHNIHPSHIEALALRHPDVEKAAAFPVADERLGEKVCLAVVGTTDGEGLLAHLAAEGLSRYDMPEWFLALDAFPLTASGKILKRTLVREVHEGRLSPRPVRYAAEAKGERA